MDVKCICQRFGFEPAPGREIEAKRIPPFAKKDPWDKYQRFLSSFDGVIIHFGNAVLSRIINSQIIMTVHSTFNLNNRATTTFHTPKCRIRITWRILKPRSSFLSESWCSILPIRWHVFGSLGGSLKQRLSTASFKDSPSSKDNFIEVRTKIIVGVIP